MVARVVNWDGRLNLPVRVLSRLRTPGYARSCVGLSCGVLKRLVKALRDVNSLMSIALKKKLLATLWLSLI
jgi:hypothetical protein